MGENLTLFEQGALAAAYGLIPVDDPRRHARLAGAVTSAVTLRNEFLAQVNVSTTGVSQETK